MIQLWNMAEAYVEQVQSRQARSGNATHTEQRKHDHEARLARQSMQAQSQSAGVTE